MNTVWYMMLALAIAMLIGGLYLTSNLDKSEKKSRHMFALARKKGRKIGRAKALSQRQITTLSEKAVARVKKMPRKKPKNSPGESSGERICNYDSISI